MGFPVEMFPGAVRDPRTAGWMAQWAELLADEGNSAIARPKAALHRARHALVRPIEQRDEVGADETEVRGPL